MTEEAPPGPIDFVLVEFPAGASTAAVADATVAVADSGVIRLFDIALVSKDASGQVSRLDLADPDISVDGFGQLAGAQSGLFDATDIDEAGEALAPDTVGLLLAYENAWAEPFVAAALDAGGQMVASERIPAQVLLDALTAGESDT